MGHGDFEDLLVLLVPNLSHTVAGYLGRLRRGKPGLFPASEEHSWRKQCVFEHPLTKDVCCYLMCLDKCGCSAWVQSEFRDPF